MFLLLSVACLGRKGAPSKGSPGLAGLQTGAPVAGFASICCTRAQVPPRGGIESLCPPAAFLRSFLCPCSFGSCASLCSPCLARSQSPPFQTSVTSYPSLSVHLLTSFSLSVAFWVYCPSWSLPAPRLLPVLSTVDLPPPNREHLSRRRNSCPAIYWVHFCTPPMEQCLQFSDYVWGATPP